MNLREVIKKHLKGRDILKEYLIVDEIDLMRYLSKSKKDKMRELPDRYYDFFDDFIIDNDIDFEKPIDLELDGWEFMEWLENNEPEVYNQFAEYLYEKIIYFSLDMPHQEYPSWAFYDDSPKIVKNQWLIHLTNDAEEIAREGFKYGVDDLTKLGLTSYFKREYKKIGGYNFAFTLNDFSKYWKKGDYGGEAVIFNASGIRVFHNGDEEYQVIFKGSTATNIIPITKGENEIWGVYNKSDRLLYENDDLRKVADWVVNNFSQYRKNLK